MQWLGWTLVIKGKLDKRHIYSTKRSLLISYDMIALSGLRRCERELRKRDMIPVHIVLATCKNGQRHDGWVDAKKGKLGKCEEVHATKSDALDCAILFERRSQEPFLLTWDIHYWQLRPPYKGIDKRRLSTLRRLKKQDLAELNRRGVVAVKVRMVRATRRQLRY